MCFCYVHIGILPGSREFVHCAKILTEHKNSDKKKKESWKYKLQYKNYNTHMLGNMINNFLYKWPHQQGLTYCTVSTNNTSWNNGTTADLSATANHHILAKLTASVKKINNI